VLGDAWWAAADHSRLEEMATRLGPLMRFRQERPEPMLSLNLADMTAVRERIAVGADGRDMPIAAYRQRVEELIRTLLARNPVLQRIQAGEEVSEEDLERTYLATLTLLYRLLFLLYAEARDLRRMARHVCAGCMSFDGGRRWSERPGGRGRSRDRLHRSDRQRRLNDSSRFAIT